ncbi:MAG TPA: helix-turn-helix transcriptional regulator [Thermoanaerobaculia bacterium]|jgi:transcriptional regulator with XRE-family HTH domain|nr:helix-turn-helix transcriptional regulator [Thermoanaerobaculia bacterium]
MAKDTSGERSGLSLGEYLRCLRASKEWTLREVEEATNGEVSNAYLSQLENDKINKPSPNILHSLARVYGASYASLMTKAGYLAPREKRKPGSRHGAAATHAPFGDLSDDEERALLTYLAMYRKVKPKP